MAVEIPVIIDIEGAFADAASRVGAAIKPLQREISKEALEVEVSVELDEDGDKVTETLGEILKKGKTSMSELSKYIDTVQEQLVGLSQTGDKDSFAWTLEAYHYLKDMGTAASVSKNEIEGLANTFNGLNARVSAARQTMEASAIGSDEWMNAVVALQEASEAANKLQKEIDGLGRKAGSLDSLNAELSDIREKLQSMGESEMFNADGTITKSAQKTIDKYTELSLKIERRNKLIEEGIEKERKAAAEAQRKAEEEERAILREIEAQEKRDEAERKHKEALSMAANSMQDLNTKLAAWQQELNTADIYSAKFIEAAHKAAELKKEIQEVSIAISQFGMNTRSIDLLNSQLQEMNMQFNALSASDRQGTEGQRLLDRYRQVSQILKTEGKTLSQIVAEEEQALQKERQRAEAIQKNVDRRKYEERVLKLVGNNMRVLQEQERILSERLKKANFGSDKYAELSKRLDEVRFKMQTMNGDIGEATNAFNKQNSAVGKLSASLASYFSLYSVLRFSKQVRDVTGELEYQRVALGHLLQDEEYGASLFGRIKAAAIESPFRIKELVTYTKQLAAYRIEQEELFSTMMRLADISAGLGVEMERLILAYGQVRAASVLRGQELRQFTEAGIPLVELLAEKFTELNGRMVSTSEVFELISKRAVPFSMISEIFEDLTEKGGMFYEMQERQAQTLQGRWEKLKDALDIALQSVGDTKSFERANDIILTGLTTLFKHLNLIPKLLNGATVAWIAYGVAQSIAGTKIKKNTPYIVTRQAELQAESAKISTVTIKVLGEAKARDILTKALIKQKTATNLVSKAWAKLTIAMITNPIGLIIAAVGALATALFSFRKRTDEVTNSFQEFDDLIEKTSKDLKDVSRLDKLIDRYERLATKTDRTIKENNRLYQTMTLLQEAFPDVAIGIDKENGSLDEQIKKLKELNELKEKETRDNAETKLEAAQIELQDAEKEREKLYKKRLKAQRKMAQLEEVLAFDELYKDSKDWQNAKKEAGALTEQIEQADKNIAGIQKRIEQLNRILHPEQFVESLSEWKKVIKKIATIETEAGHIQLIGDDEIEKWETLDEALAEINKRKKEMQSREETLAKSVANTTDNVQEEIDAQREWAKTAGERYKQMENYFLKEFSNISQDFQEQFPNILESAYDFISDESIPKIGLFSDDDIKKITTIVDLYDLWSKKYKAVSSEIENYNKKLSETIDPEVREDIISTIDTLKEQKKELENVQKTYGFVLKEGGSGGYQQDPWILIFKNRIKFMKDFRNGVEDLNKYLSQTSSLSKTQGAMKGRGLALNIDVEQLTGSREELLNYYDDVIEQITKKIQILGGKTWSNLGVQAILAKDTKDRTLKAWQDLLAEVFKERTDFDLTQMKKDIEEGIKQIKEEVKRSETAKNFFNDILGLTGDIDLATTLSVNVYGTSGSDFRERMAQQLQSAFAEFDKAMKDTEVEGIVQTAIDTQDFDTILQYINYFPEEWQKMLRQMASDSEKYNADQIKTWFDELKKAKTYSEQRVEISKKTAQRIQEINKSSLPQEQKNILIKQYTKKEADEVAKAQYEAFKDSPIYVEMFSNLDAASTKMLRNMKTQLEGMKEAWKNLDPNQLKELQSRIQEIDSQLAKKSPFKTIIDALKAYNALGGTSGRKEADRNASEKLDAWRQEQQVLDIMALQYETAVKRYGVEAEITKALKGQVDEQAKNVDKAKEESDKASEIAQRFREVANAIKEGAEELEEWKGYINTLTSSASDLVNAFGTKEQAEYFEIISEGFEKTASGAVTAASGIARAISGDLTGIVDAIKGIVDMVVGIANLINGINIKQIDKRIKAYEKDIKNLEKSYERLEKAMAKAFGTDYIYNYQQQLKILEAEAEAYAKQAELEASKGKQADQDVIDDCLDKAEEAKEKIQDMQGQLAEFFTGTDLTSAARDFATAWIDAYKSFASTTGALKDKFREMIENMVVNSLAAQGIQKILEPLFKTIDEMYAEGASMEEVLTYVEESTGEYVDRADAYMNALLQRLKAAGINLRSTSSSMSGISKDIAGASEESINGLAAGINTQNFYMSYVPIISANVEAIAMALTGMKPTTATSNLQTAASSVASTTFGDETFRGQMLRIDENIADMRQMLRSVITPKAANTNTHSIGVKS